MATKKPAPKKAVAKSASKPAPAKKAAPAAKSSASKPVAKKAAPVKKAAPASKAAPAKKSVPAKKAAPVKKVVPAPAKKAAPAPAKKAAPASKTQPQKKAAPAAKQAPVKKAEPVKKVAAPAPAKAAPAPAKKAAPAPAKAVSAPTKATPAPAKAAPAPSKSAAAPAKKAAPAPAKPIPNKAPAKKVPMISPETRFAETSKVTASPAEIRKALRAKEAKKDAKPVPMPKISAKSSRKYEPEFTKSVLDSQAVVAPTGPTQRYSDTELAEFRELVQNKLNAAKQELAYLNGLITRKDSMSGEDSDTRYMTMEDGSLSMEREQLSQMASRQIDFIEKLEKAMMRIENKTYGICRVTGKLIDKARLKAVPHATLSMEAKLNMNKPGSFQNNQ